MATKDLFTPGPPVQRTMLGSQIADAIRRDVLLGVIKPGTQLSQQQVCERFGTSRMPVRDALRMLAHEGLLVTDSAQHTIVAPLSRDDFLDAYRIEGTLAGMAAERASQKAAPEDLERLEGLHQQMVKATAATEFGEMVRLNWSFHRSINKLSASRKLLSAIKTVSLDLPRDFLMELPDWSTRSNADHAGILAAMREQRHADVRELITEHIVASGRGLIAELEARGLDLD